MPWLNTIIVYVRVVYGADVNHKFLLFRLADLKCEDPLLNSIREDRPILYRFESIVAYPTLVRR